MPASLSVAPKGQGNALGSGLSPEKVNRSPRGGLQDSLGRLIDGDRDRQGGDEAVFVLSR
jgi:hypothetical protein